MIVFAEGYMPSVKTEARAALVDGYSGLMFGSSLELVTAKSDRDNNLNAGFKNQGLTSMGHILSFWYT